MPLHLDKGSMPGEMGIDWMRVAVGYEARIMALEAVIRSTRALVAEAALTGFQPLEGDWAERLFHNQQALTRALEPKPVSE